MSFLQQFWSTAMLLLGALLMGGAVWYAWDRSVIWRTLSLEEFARDFHRSIGRADPAQPILAVVCPIAAIGFAAVATGTPRLLAVAATVGLMVNVVVSLVLLVPTQYAFVRQPEGRLPREATARRRRWLRGHLFRTGVVVASFTLLVLAAVAR